jgi:hypothetical protein
MRSSCGVALLVIGAFLANAGEAQQAKAKDFTVLMRADLVKLVGVWEMKVQTKKGWKGIVRATITLYPAGSKEKDFGRILYDYDLARGKDKMSIQNAPLGGIAFAGVKQGNRLLLVTAEREGLGPTVPFKVDPKPDLSAPLTLTDGKLVLDVTRSVKPFCFPLTGFDLEWGRLQFTKGKKE